jgi:hypothetical protein
MANKTLFKSLIGKLIPATDAVNESSLSSQSAFRNPKFRGRMLLGLHLKLRLDETL